jgi:hypothetical protein
MSRQIYVGLLISRPGSWFAMVWTSSVGSVTADPLYEIADTYLAFWFGVLRDDVDLIEGGQGAAVLELQRKQIFVPEPADDVPLTPPAGPSRSGALVEWHSRLAIEARRVAYGLPPGV